jgi:hypothetical protein
MRRERVRRAGSDTATDHGATARQQIDEAPVIAARIRPARSHRPRNDAAIFDFTYEEGRAAREMIAYRNAVGSRDRNAIVIHEHRTITHCTGARITTPDAGIEYTTFELWRPGRKITVEVPAELLERAQQASGAGVTQTVRSGLQ